MPTADLFAPREPVSPTPFPLDPVESKLSAEGLAEYLAVHPELIGIGPAKAKLLADAFGDDFAGALKGRRAEMADVAKVSAEVIDTLATFWLGESAGRQKTRMWLASLGLTFAQITAIESKYKEGARAVLQKNPYLLAREVKGFGFSRADAVAKLAGIELTSEPRIEACAEYVVRERQNDGHTWISYGDASSKIAKLLELPWEVDQPVDRIEKVVSRLVHEGRLTGTWINPETWALSTPRLFRQERECSFVLKKLGKLPNRWRREFLAAGASEREKDLTEAQRQALGLACNARVCVVTGGAGTGKTFVMSVIAKRYQAAGLKIELAAPTGKAAKRMGEMELEDVTPQTLHRLLGYDGKAFGRRKGMTRGGHGQGQEQAPEGESDSESETREKPEPIDADVVLVDEASMIDVGLLYELLRGLNLSRTSLVFFGDPHQLPSVGAGSVLRDLIDRAIVPVVRLEVVMRQAGILKAASMGVLEGKIAGSSKEEIAWKPSHCGRDDGSAPTGCCGGTDASCDCECNRCYDHVGIPADVTWPWVVLRKSGDLAIAEAVEKLFAEDLQGKLGIDPQTVQVIAPSYKGEAGVDALNARLQAVVQRKRGVEAGTIAIGKWGKTRPMVGDRVLQTRNNYELGEDGGVMNGTVGVLVGEEKGGAGRGSVWRVRIDDEEIVYDAGQVKQLELAYALTVHKAQGSEFPVVVVVVSKSHSFMLHRNLLYTAVTRAQKMVVLVGDESGMVGAVKRTLLEKRKTFLGNLKEREGYKVSWFEGVT